jgi:iron complex transport system substrate-binding protein
MVACRAPQKEPAGPRPRVVCLTPSMTEVMDALGAIDLVVAVDKFSALPAVQHLPKVGDFLSPNLEAIAAQGSDIVLLDAVQTNVIEGLKAAKIRSLALPMQNIEDVRSALRAVGAALGREAAASAAAARLDERLAAETRRAEAGARTRGARPRVLFVVDRRPGGLSGMVAAGPGTYIDELLARAAAVNVLADAPVRYVQISPEEVIQRAPEVIFDAVHDLSPERARADWAPLSSVPAVKDGRVYVLGSSLYVTPGPRLAEALAGLVDFLWAGR